MNKNTSIRIEAVLEMSNAGEKGFRVTDVKALKKEDLPALYLDGEREIVYKRPDYNQPGLFLRHGDRTININDENGILVDKFITVAGMEKALAHISAAGRHLTDVNAKIKEETENWIRMFLENYPCWQTIEKVVRQDKIIFINGVETQNREMKELVRPRESQFDESIKLAEKFVKLLEENRLLYRNKENYAKSLKSPK